MLPEIEGRGKDPRTRRAKVDLCMSGIMTRCEVGEVTEAKKRTMFRTRSWGSAGVPNGMEDMMKHTGTGTHISVESVAEGGHQHRSVRRLEQSGSQAAYRRVQWLGRFAEVR